MTPRAQEVHSYLIGLGPVGKPVLITREMLATDLNIKGAANWCRIVKILIEDGCIQRVSSEVMIVLKRIPAEPEPEPKEEDISAPHLNSGHWCERPKIIQDWERLAREILEDTRDLTARLFGDPVWGRSALARRASLTDRVGETA